MIVRKPLPAVLPPVRHRAAQSAVAWLMLAVAGALAAQPATAAPAALELQFAVSYDDRQIGTHRFEIRRDGAQKAVRSEADFLVRVVFVTLYRYQHLALERWQDGCLRQLESETNDNGRRYQVRIDDDPAALRIERRAPEAAVESVPIDCAASFAYWDLAELERTALINSQTGAVTPVRLDHLGADVVDGIPAHHYRLQPEGLDPIDLWYRQSDGLWLRLETRRDTSVLRYRLTGVTGAEPLETVPASGA